MARICAYCGTIVDGFGDAEVFHEACYQVHLKKTGGVCNEHKICIRYMFVKDGLRREKAKGK